MTDFIIKKLPYELSSHAGLALIGQYLKSIQLKSLFDTAFPIRAGIATSDVLKSYLGLPSSTSKGRIPGFLRSRVNEIKEL